MAPGARLRPPQGGGLSAFNPQAGRVCRHRRGWRRGARRGGGAGGGRLRGAEPGAGGGGARRGAATRDDDVGKPRWLQKLSAVPEDSAPPAASLDDPKAQAAPTQPEAQPGQLGGVPWSQEPASGGPKVEKLRSLRFQLAGKTLYHARISPASAERLAPMPPLLVWPTDGVPAPEVSYEGAKAGAAAPDAPPPAAPPPAAPPADAPPLPSQAKARLAPFFHSPPPSCAAHHLRRPAPPCLLPPTPRPVRDS